MFLTAPLHLHVLEGGVAMRSREEERVQNGAGPGPRRGDVRIMDCVRFFQLGGASVALLTVSGAGQPAGDVFAARENILNDVCTISICQTLVPSAADGSRWWQILGS